VLAVGLAVVLMASCRGLVPVQLPPQPLASNPVKNRVILIVSENQKLAAIIGNKNAPYLNSLATQFAYANNFFADTHPSIGNYFMLTTGQIITNDLNFAGVVDVNNIVRQLGQNSVSWKAYLQSMPRPGYLGDNAYPYAKTHNPFAYFTDIQLLPAQAANTVPLTGFASDLANDTLPSFVFIAPDQEHNMHDCLDGTRNCTNDQKVAAGDAWIQQTVQPIINSPGFQKHNTLIIITWDESWDNDSANGGGHIPVIFVGSDVKNGFVETQFALHESILKLMLNYLGVPDSNLGNATNATDISDILVTPPSQLP
jgi:acid phosphatase